MNLLLDTHIWLWSLLEPERLAANVSTSLVADGVRLWLSPLSVWEASLLIERGRVRVDAPAEKWLRQALEQAPFEEAPVTREVAFASRRLQSRHRDPVDRFLAATSQVFELTLVTADERLLKTKGLNVLANRGSSRRAPKPEADR